MQILGDFCTSVKKALKEIDPNYEKLHGLVICGTHNPKKEEIDRFLYEIEYAREHDRPYLGLCFGHQLAAIEYARNVLGIKDATSEEFGKGTFVVKKRADLNVGHKVDSSYWNNYEVVIDWKPADHFITTQGHPEYESSYWKPHPLLKKYIYLRKQLMK